MNRDKRLTRKILLAGLVLSLILSAVYFVHPAVVRFFNDKAMDAVMAMAHLLRIISESGILFPK